jgi:hypothetical protein
MALFCAVLPMLQASILLGIRSLKENSLLRVVVAAVVLDCRYRCYCCCLSRMSLSLLAVARLIIDLPECLSVALSFANFIHYSTNNSIDRLS